MMNILWVIVRQKKDGCLEPMRDERGVVAAYEDLEKAYKRQKGIMSHQTDKFHVMEYVCTFYSSPLGRMVPDGAVKFVASKTPTDNIDEIER